MMMEKLTLKNLSFCLHQILNKYCLFCTEDYRLTSSQIFENIKVFCGFRFGNYGSLRCCCLCWLWRIKLLEFRIDLIISILNVNN